MRVAFVELYKETLYDLLSPKDKKEDCAVDLREDPRSGVTITNLTEVCFTVYKYYLMSSLNQIHISTNANGLEIFEFSNQLGEC